MVKDCCDREDVRAISEIFNANCVGCRWCCDERPCQFSGSLRMLCGSANVPVLGGWFGWFLCCRCVSWEVQIIGLDYKTIGNSTPNFVEWFDQGYMVWPSLGLTWVWFDQIWLDVSYAACSLHGFLYNHRKFHAKFRGVVWHEFGLTLVWRCVRSDGQIQWMAKKVHRPKSWRNVQGSINDSSVRTVYEKIIIIGARFSSGPYCFWIWRETKRMGEGSSSQILTKCTGNH